MFARLAVFRASGSAPVEALLLDAELEGGYCGLLGRVSHMGVGPVEVEMGATAPLAIRRAPITAGTPSGRDPVMTTPRKNYWLRGSNVAFELQLLPIKADF